jgi:hypothetical protein
MSRLLAEAYGTGEVPPAALEMCSPEMHFDRDLVDQPARSVAPA